MSDGLDERALLIDCDGAQLLGVLHAPPSPPRLGVVIIVGGPQYRAGSQRQFVHLARSLTLAGHAVLRFDVRGMGDSTGEPRGFEHLDDDTAHAIDALCQRQPSIRGVVLWGLCDGASAALMYVDATRDARVVGVCAVNPWVRSPASLARTHLRHYYLQRMREPAFWRKLLSGRVAMRVIPELLAKLIPARVKSRSSIRPQAEDDLFQVRMARGWSHLEGRVLLVLSGRDYTAKEFVEYTTTSDAWQRVLHSAPGERRELVDADHTFSDQASREAVASWTISWLGTIADDSPVRA